MPLPTQPPCNAIFGWFNWQFPLIEYQNQTSSTVDLIQQVESALGALSVTSTVHTCWGTWKHAGKMRHGHIPTWEECWRRDFIFSLFPLLWEFLRVWLVKKACQTYGCACTCMSVTLYIRTQSPLESFWRLFSSPRVQEDFCQLWRKTATNKCYPGPVTFTRNHLLLGHEPACVEKPAQKSVGEDGTEQEEESWPVRNAVAVECSMDLECFQSWIPWSRWRGEERIRRTTYPLTTACSITGQPQCSQHAPWFLL